MTPLRIPADDLASLIAERAAGKERFTVAIAGAPGAGKSTLAATLATALGSVAMVVPMDGFHFDNAILEARGQMAVKGAPETFDVAGFSALLARLATEDAVAIPVFDRAADLARAGAAIISGDTPLRIVEGNYLLLDEAPWRELKGAFDLTIFLDVPRGVLAHRLVQRWLDHGLPEAQARERAFSNDMINAERLIAARLEADIVIRSGG